MKPSVRAPRALCEPSLLLRRCVSLAVLDAILSPDWQYRYYSFDGAWSEDTLMASMRDGSGDDLFIAFGAGGVFLKGFVHDAPMAPRASGRDGTVWPGMYDGVPTTLEIFRDEPAFSRDSITFCLWWDVERPGWQVGVREFPAGQDPDGSEHLLAIYDGEPETYYESDVPLDAVAAIYRPRTSSCVSTRTRR